MAEKTAAQKKAQKTYMERFFVARVRISKELYAKVKTCAEARGESINEFLTSAIENHVIECHT